MFLCVFVIHLQLVSPFYFVFQGSSPYDNVEDWKQKLILLLYDKEKQELISREKKDRRDFEQISALASSMGLYRYFLLHCCRPFDQCIIICFELGSLSNIITFGSHLYAKVVVFSKVPLPNYRFDLDDRRPQREVLSCKFSLNFRLFLLIYSFSLQSTVEL